ncbi:hypothetical protein MBM_07003 [Drepanopeziza brunnea f. sp. 'multigermtubi' MB_m1]|uniref:Uncharacterized protein n=1 Tax=Marssonina brunnea f. sp. multigermtubi (strain MB_m1) TaxID=1072389 RepID=K1WR00_MARBU|nr:uncharacterized protein MBM_07003 [Drepanopeziza brunnea f. sp. 'multigermtubi' MB_m1]EKD14792.1 hypothetical protein MBM_07003 [Drepanopeziza brunnea f. sp. 'multigermtubi' MB_m1]
MLRLQSTFALLLVLSLFNGAHGFWWRWSRKQVIGYAMVSEEHANLINKYHDLIVQDGTNFQVGPGFYLRDKPSWESQEGKWYCVVKANTKKMKKARKAMIPKTYEILIAPRQFQTTRLYGAEESVIANYIIRNRGIYEPEITLRFSWVDGVVDQQRQMTIPKQMATSGDLDFWAKCFETEKKLRKYSDKTIEWERDWKPRVNFKSIAPRKEENSRV